MHGHYIGDPQVYRSKEAQAEAREHDPIDLLRAKMELPDEEFEALGRTISDVERHREDTGGQPFSSEQIRERAQRILERDEVSSEDLAERARRYTTWEYRHLFAEDDPLLGPHAGEPPQRRRLRDRVPTVGGSARRDTSRPQRPSWTRRRSHGRDDGD
jgi:hypothetical protein